VKRKHPFPSNCNVLDAFLWYLDIANTPKVRSRTDGPLHSCARMSDTCARSGLQRGVLEIMSGYATDEADKAKIAHWLGAVCGRALAPCVRAAPLTFRAGPSRVPRRSQERA
jgi:hypothetical protein